jgi:hypothetical protein
MELAHTAQRNGTAGGLIEVLAWSRPYRRERYDFGE